LSAFLILTIASCAPDAQQVLENNAELPQGTLEIEPIEPVDAVLPTSSAPIMLPLTAYILDDQAGERSSQRTAEQLRDVVEKTNTIWAPAGIIIDLQAVHRVQVPAHYLTAVSSSDFEQFYSGINRDFTLPEPSLLNAFYAADIGGANGITPFRTHTFFVTDFPSVHHERVTSHEIGHILGLHHVPDNADQLMFSGTNGMTLSAEEIAVARYAAKGLLDGLR